MSVDVGSQAPDFELRDQSGQPVRLSDYRGKKNVTVVFYPLSFTAVCTAELCALREQFADLSADDHQLLAISVDSTAVHKELASRRGYDFPLLADFWPHGQVARAYGVFDERLGVALRGTFILDRDGIVAYRAVNQIPNARDTGEYRLMLDKLA